MSDTMTNPSASATIQCNLSSTAGAALNTTTVNHSVANQPTVGSSSGNVNKVYTGVTTIASSGSAGSLDLTSLTDPQGNALTFSKVQWILIENLDTTTGHDVTPGGGTTPVIITQEALLAGTTPGRLFLDFGNTQKTVDSTHKLLALATAAGTNVQVKVTIVGQ